LNDKMIYDYTYIREHEPLAGGQITKAGYITRVFTPCTKTY